MGVLLLSAEKLLVKCEMTSGVPRVAARALPAMVFALLNPVLKGKGEGRWMPAVQRLMWATLIPGAGGCREHAASESKCPGSQQLLFQLKQLIAPRNTADKGIQ